MTETDEVQLRSSALYEANKAHKNGNPVKAEEVVERAKAFYDFLRGGK